VYFNAYLISHILLHLCCTQAAECPAASADDQQTDVKTTTDYAEETAHEDEQ